MHIDITITSVERFKKTVRALNETMQLIQKEMTYPEHLQNNEYLERSRAHQDKLAAAIRVYVENGGAVN